MAQCVLCDGKLEFLREYIFRTKEFKNIYKDNGVYQCPACDLVQIDTSKVTDSNLTEYYRYAYRNVAKITSIETEASKLRYTGRGIALLRMAEANVETEIRRVFEVGAGYGYNLKVAKDAHPDASIFTDEIDEDFTETMNSRQASLNEGPYDVIILSHVIEHFRRPQDIVGDAIKALSPGGVIVAEVPNDLDGISSVTPCDEPHITFFTGATFQKLVESVPGARLDKIVIAGPVNRRYAPSQQTLNSSIKYLVPSPIRRIRRRLIKAIKGEPKPKIPDYTTPTQNGIYMRSAIKAKA